MGVQTDEILGQITMGNNDEDKVDFVDKEAVLLELRGDIEARSSLTKFAHECGIHPSHLCEYFNQAKKLGRDKLLAVLINLQYGLEKSQTMLRRLELQELYVRNKRDYQIAVCIQDGKSLDETEEVLRTKGLQPLMEHGKPGKNLPQRMKG